VFRSSYFLVVPLSLAFCHLILNNADDGHEDGAAYPAAGDVAPPPAAALPITIWRSVPPSPPPTIPAIEFPTVPRLFSFMAAPATLPPTAPLIASIIRLMMFMFGFLFVRACIGLAGSANKTTQRNPKVQPTSRERLLRNARPSVNEGHVALRLRQPLKSANKT